MKRKSMIALGMAAVLTMGTCVPVLAADNTFSKDDSNAKNTEVTFTAASKYEVTIPAEVVWDSEQGTTIMATLATETSKTLLEDKAAVQIVMTGVTNNLLEIKAGNEVTSPTIKIPVEGKATENLDTTNSTATYTLKPASDLVEKAGSYTGTLTFAVSYVDPA